ncbi:hypothetical protein HBI23_048150 [Parastagonospora nodorum]|nr:hypothetical protein HBI12_030530 [Parastagonospora nodorum]KAH5454279.1 hypothetical protein HBI47_013290 [Parastagonospora nodorum]KAH5686128.1 hypothetical protein HBI23_048150 [Parastagonospora nodorum]
MDPRHNQNWPPQAYNNGQYVPYPPQQQQPNAYQHQGYAPQYPPMQQQMPQGYPQLQAPQTHPHMSVSRPPSQQYPPMPQAYAQQQQQQQPRAQPQVVIPPKAPSYVSPMQHMQPPKIRHVQMPVQRNSSSGIAQADGTQDRRRYSNQQHPTPSQSKQVQRSPALQENGPRPQQKTSSTPVQQHRTPLQQQSTPQQRIPSSSQTPSSQHRSPSIQSTTPKPKGHPQVVIPRSSNHHLTPTRHAQPPPKALPADLSVMLLSAADEYIAAARGMGTRVVRSRREADVLQYHKLMATGLGCMDTVLRDFHLLPRDEARLRLRYATLLAEETDNTAEIDEVLSKQISLCGRCRLQDLKYASLHLQARYQFKTNHRAALKSLDKPITEAETFQHIAWVYAFRFLKVALTLQISGRIELVPALQQLHAIAAHSERRGDRAIYVACNALEALVHLRSGAADRLEQAQRAIASARSLQLQVSAEQLGSFGTLLDIIDVTCGIHNGVPDGTKSTALISGVLDEKADALQSHTGILTVVIERSSGGSMTFDSGGIFRKNPAGCDELVFVWLPKEDLQTLCFFICAYDQHVHEKGLKYIREAHHRAKSASNRHVSHSIPIPLAVAQQEWNSVLDWHSLFVIGLIACHREDAATATEALTILKKRAVKSKPNEETARTLAYLTAVSDQRNGAFESALRAYSSDLFQLPSQASSVGTKVDLAILAALNRVLIVRYPGHPQQHIATTLLKQLTPLCENHPNQYIRVAHRLVHAMSSPDTTTDASIMRKKTFVQAAVNRTSDILKKTQNREFVTMALSYFSSSFFANQVSDKAVQAVRATRHNNKWSRSPLWTAVAAGMCMHTYQQNGLLQDAQESKREYEAVMHLLPSPLRNGSDVDAEGEEEDDDLV